MSASNIGVPARLLPNLARAVRRLLGAGDWREREIFARLEQHFARAEQLVGFFYLFLVYYAYSRIASLHNMADHAFELEYLWPIAWVQSLDLLVVVDVLGVASMGLALLAFLNPRKAIYRIVFPFAYLPLIAIPSSLGSIHHNDHATFWIAVVFAFLPTMRDRGGKLAYCLTFSCAQGLLLTFYTMAGYHKVTAGLSSLLAGEVSNFSPRGLATTLAERSEQTGTHPLIADFLIHNYWLAWPMFLVLIYAQFAAIFAVARPRLHAIFGILLVIFHTGTFLLMEITFPLHIFLVMLLLVSSPFQNGPRFAISNLVMLPGVVLLRSITASWRPEERHRLAST